MRDDAHKNGAGPPHLLAVQHAVGDDRAEPRQRRPRPAVRPARLRARRRRRARHAQLVGLLGLRRAEGDAVGRRPRQVPGAADVVATAASGMIGGSYDGTTANMVASQGDARPRAEGDRPDRGDLALVRLRVRGRRPLLPELRGADRRGRRHAVRASTSASRAPRRPTPTTRSSPTSSPRASTRATRSRTRRRATTRRPTTTTSGSSATTAATPTRFRAAVARRPRLAGLQRQAGGGRRALRGAAGAARSTARSTAACTLLAGLARLAVRRRWDALLERVPRPLPARPRHRHREDAARSSTEGRTVADDGVVRGDRLPRGARGRRRTSTLRLWLRRTFDQDVPGVELPPPSHRRDRRARRREPNREEKDNVFTWVGAPTSRGARQPRPAQRARPRLLLAVLRHGAARRSRCASSARRCSTPSCARPPAATCRRCSSTSRPTAR